jgi:hypothetical protein
VGLAMVPVLISSTFCQSVPCVASYIDSMTLILGDPPSYGATNEWVGVLMVPLWPSHMGGVSGSFERWFLILALLVRDSTFVGV